jgi:hypothetical protein
MKFKRQGKYAVGQGRSVKTELLLDSIDVWLLQQDTLIIKRKKSMILAVTQRQV